MSIVAIDGSSKISLKGINFANSTSFKIYRLMTSKILLIVSSLKYKWLIWMRKIHLYHPFLMASKKE
jgi:hypothetical protein